MKVQKGLKLPYKTPSLSQKMMTRDSLFKRSDLWDERCSIVWDSHAIWEAVGLMRSTSWLVIIIFTVNRKYFSSSEFVPQLDIRFFTWGIWCQYRNLKSLKASDNCQFTKLWQDIKTAMINPQLRDCLTSGSWNGYMYFIVGYKLIQFYTQTTINYCEVKLLCWEINRNSFFFLGK